MGESSRSIRVGTDTELIRSSREDPAAFEALVQRHAVLLDRWLRAQTGDGRVAHELMAETFAQAWASRRRFRGEDENSGAAWLYGIARNLLRQHLRKGRLECSARRRLGIAGDLSHGEEEEEIASRIDAQGMAPAVREAFAELTLEQQKAIRFRVVDELSYEEVADRLGCTPVTARSRVFRGLRTLRASVNKGASS
jgi:RNA polymerase sigma-70 factor (ECF subfamily)